MNTQLLEVVTGEGATIRGLYSIPNTTSPEKQKGIVVCCPGFGRACTEIKFRCMTEEMIRREFGVLRFDFQGIGISGGDYGNMTVDRCAYDLANMILNIPTDKSVISFFAHSLGACVVLRLLQLFPETRLDKIVFMNPALNQKDLLRCWFKKSKSKSILRSVMEIHDEEDLFLQHCREEKVVGSYKMRNGYHLENQEKDYTPMLAQHAKKLMIIHGKNDTSVPEYILKKDLPGIAGLISVPLGDHDLEKPEMRRVWLESAVNFFGF